MLFVVVGLNFPKQRVVIEPSTPLATRNDWENREKHIHYTYITRTLHVFAVHRAMLILLRTAACNL